jgi:hypothetical protein
MRQVGERLRERFDLGVLSTGRHSSYERLGWERWQGPSYVRQAYRIFRTADEDAGIMVLRYGPTAGLDLTQTITCESRSGDQSKTLAWLSDVKGARLQSLPRSRRLMPASRAITSSSDGQPWRGCVQAATEFPRPGGDRGGPPSARLPREGFPARSLGRRRARHRRGGGPCHRWFVGWRWRCSSS